MALSGQPCPPTEDPIEKIAPEVYDEVSPAFDSARSGFFAESETGGLTLTIPDSGTQPVELISAEKNVDISVTLPSQTGASAAQPGKNGTVE